MEAGEDELTEGKEDKMTASNPTVQHALDRSALAFFTYRFTVNLTHYITVWYSYIVKKRWKASKLGL